MTSVPLEDALVQYAPSWHEPAHAPPMISTGTNPLFCESVTEKLPQPLCTLERHPNSTTMMLPSVVARGHVNEFPVSGFSQAALELVAVTETVVAACATGAPGMRKSAIADDA